MAGPDDTSPVGHLQQGFTAADAQPTGYVGQVCETCPDNWVEAGATDEATGQPIPGIGYRIFDLATGDRVASGILDNEGKSPRHSIPVPVTQLYVVVGTEAAMDAAEEQISEMQRQRALQANARPDWNGIPAGLDEAGFNNAFNQQTMATGQMPPRNPSLLGASAAGWKGIYDLVTSGFDMTAAQNEFYLDERARSFDEYQMVTGAREASRWESLGGGAGQGVSFGFGDEGMATLDSLFSNRTYEESVAARRQLMEAQRLANPGYYLGGEIAGAIPTVFVPIGGAAANAARAGQTAAGVVRAGATTGMVTGGLSGAGHDEGGIVDRLDGAALGAASGGVAGALFAGAGVLVARGVAKTRIWARASLNRGTGPLRGPARTPLANEDLPIGPEQGLQSRQSGVFDNVVEGQHGDAASKYLWTVDERGINIAPEATPWPTPRGNIVHTNISDEASIGGEAWFGPNNTVTINAGSGRFGDGANITPNQWDAAIRYWQDIGYEVVAIPFGER
jgi:hypothetical protein